MMVPISMDREACLDNRLVYVQIQLKELEEDEFSCRPFCLTRTNLMLTLIVLQAGKTSLSANAPACVAVWGWEGLAGCVLRRAPPPACGIALAPGD